MRIWEIFKRYLVELISITFHDVCTIFEQNLLFVVWLLLDTFIGFCLQIFFMAWQVEKYLRKVWWWVTNYSYVHFIKWTKLLFHDNWKEFKWNVSETTGWPKSKSVISNGYPSKIMHFWPYVGKAKMRLRGSSFFFNFRKFV